MPEPFDHDVKGWSEEPAPKLPIDLTRPVPPIVNKVYGYTNAGPEDLKPKPKLELDPDVAARYYERFGVPKDLFSGESNYGGHTTGNSVATPTLAEMKAAFEHAKKVMEDFDKQYPDIPDVFVMTKSQYAALIRAINKDKPAFSTSEVFPTTDALNPPGLEGIAIEAYETELEVKVRALELQRQGKRVGIITQTERQSIPQTKGQ